MKNQHRKRIALYGGSFDPPHLGHVITIRDVLNSGLVDEIWLVPLGRDRKKECLASAHARKEMIAIMLSTMFGSRVPVYMDTTQKDRPFKISTTDELLDELRIKYPDYQFKIVIGTDLISQIPSWEKSSKLMKKDLFLAVHRLGESLNSKLPHYIKLVKSKNLAVTNISSTIVRSMIGKNESLEGIVPPAVINYIIKNKLYLYNVKCEPQGKQILYSGNFINMAVEDGWEYVERNNCSGVVVIVCLTAEKEVIFVEQYRKPVNSRVIEFPAGLVNDTAPVKKESLRQAAARELLEETGYDCVKLQYLTKGPTSSGLTSEVQTYFLAKGAGKTAKGGGDASEFITVHKVLFSKVEEWLREKEREECLISPKVYAGLYFLSKELH